MNQTRFSRFENLAQRLVEGTFGRLFGEQLLAREVAGQLSQAVEDYAENGFAPTHYRLALNPSDYAAVTRQLPRLKSHLTGYIQEIGRQANLRLAREPVVELVTDPTVRRHQVVVEAAHDSSTTQTGARVQKQDPPRLQAMDAFLIVNGRRHIPLNRPLTTIGRRMDNDVIIDSPLVSREHAHIRWRYGRFVLYDVGSRSGVAVNGEPAKETVLQPGDLITLADGISLIYGEGLEARGQLPPPNEADTNETLTFRADGSG